MASTVLRVKRRLEDNPQDALVLMCKRLKKDNEEISPSLFVFRGTVEHQETPNVRNIAPKTELRQQSSSKVKDIIQKLRNERKEQITESRYEVVNLSRGLKHEDDELGEFDLVDLQRNEEDDKEDMQYAYDLYMATHDFDVSMLDQLVRIEHYESELVFSQGDGSSSDGADEDDDSNDENNWRNEYPDSEASSIDEDAIVRAMERVDIDSLSSDDGEDKVYNDPLVPSEDVKRYGEAYAKYKARVVGEKGIEDSRGFVHCAPIKDLDEESVEGYKDNSEDEGFYYGQEQDTEQFQEQYASGSDDDYKPD